MAQSQPRKLITVLLAVHALGAANSLRVLRFTLYRHWLDYLYRRKQRPPISTGIGVYHRSQLTPTGSRFEFEHASLDIDFLAQDLARLTWNPGTLPLPYALAEVDWPPVSPEFSQIADGFCLATQDLTIALSLDGSLSFSKPSGERLRQVKPPIRQGAGWIETSLLAEEEHLYGLGEQAGDLNLRRQIHQIWNRDPGGSYGKNVDPLYMPLPCYFSLHAAGSYLIFYENHYQATFSPGKGEEQSKDTYQAQFSGGCLRYYFIPGTAPAAIERFSQLTGKSALPPAWSLGYQQSRWGYKSQKEIETVVSGFEEHSLRLSAIHLDLDYMEDRRGFTVDSQRFPDLAGLAADLDKSGIRLVAIIDPGIKVDAGFDIYRDGVGKGVFCTLPNSKPLTAVAFSGLTRFPDFTDPEVRQWWSGLYAPLLEAGISGIWHDMNEPTAFNAWGGNELPLATQHALEGAGGDHLQAHNLYGLQMNRAGFEALRNHQPDKRPWILSRSGWIGNQRYAWNWTADTESTWEGLQTNIATVIGLGLCGIPYCGPDIGGFSGNPTAELYVRWFQMAAFMPFFRTHSALITQPREPWVFGEPYTSIIRRAIDLRYRLMPYFYTLAWEATEKGFPFVRPLFWHTPEDRRLWDVSDTYLFGDALLVAPVVEPAAKQREIIFPAGEWFNYWDDAQFRGPGQLSVPITLESIPIFVRGGSVLPTADSQRLSLHIYPGEGISPIYSDAGEGYGPWRIDRFTIKRSSEGLHLDWQPRGDYPFPYAAVEVQLHGMKMRRALGDGVELPINDQQAETGIFKELILLS